MIDESRLRELFPYADQIYSLNGMQERVCIRLKNLMYIIVKDSPNDLYSYEFRIFMLGAKEPFKVDTVKDQNLVEYSHHFQEYLYRK